MIVKQKTSDEMLQKMIEAKAALFTRGDEKRLIEEAIRAYPPEAPTRKCECGGKTHLHFRDRIITVFLNSENPMDVTVKNAPSFICERCGEEYYGLTVEAFLEREIEEEILKHLRARKEPLVVFDFFDDFLNAV